MGAGTAKLSAQVNEELEKEGKEASFILVDRERFR